MYQPDPLNWIAGVESNRWTGPLPQRAQVSGGGSVYFWMISKRCEHASH
jgi:hypothetical protein